jgi:hypothetical protein
MMRSGIAPWKSARNYFARQRFLGRKVTSALSKLPDASLSGGAELPGALV